MTAEPLLGPREHPSPHRTRVSLTILLLALAAGPAAWILQLCVDFGVATAACQPGGVPPASGWGPEHVFLVCVNLVCLALALTGGFVALAAWRRTSQEKSGGAARLIEVGEGRTRFLAACAMMAAGAFAVAILFDTAWPLFVPSCWRFAP